MRSNTPTRSTPPGWLIVAALTFNGLISAYMYTLVVPLQAELPRLLDAPRELTSWVVTSTLLVSAITTPISGRLGDMYGKRRVMFALLLILIAGSCVAALSPSITGLIVGRSMQGLTTGVVPLGIATMRDLLAPKHLGTAVALMSATMGVGGAVGMPLAAFIAEVADWHLLFWMSALLGAAGLLGIRYGVPESGVRARGKLDVRGIVGLSLGLGGIMLYLARGADWGWFSAPALGALGSGSAILAVWGRYQLRRTAPLVNLRIAATPVVLCTNLAGVGMGFALFASNVTFPQLLELPPGTGFGLSMFQAALCIMPSGIIMMLLSPVSGLLERLFTARLLLQLGTGATVLAYLFVLLWSSEIWHIVVANTMIGFGIAFSFAAMPMIIMGAVPASETGVSNGLNALFRAVGTSAAAAVTGGVLAAMSGAHGPNSAAFTLCFGITLGAAAAAGVLAFLVPAQSRRIDA